VQLFIYCIVALSLPLLRILPSDIIYIISTPNNMQDKK